MRKPNIDLKKAKLAVEAQRLESIQSQFETLSKKIKDVQERLAKKSVLVQTLQAEIDSADFTHTEAESVS